VSTADPWTLKRECLADALTTWRERDQPDEATRKLVNDAFLDLILDPLRWGSEEPNDSGVFYGRVQGTNVGITYVLNTDDKSVCVAIIVSG
jgi:hypothetical protein